MRLDLDLIGVDRAKVVDALRAEGLDGLVVGYQNIHMLPMYQKKIGYGSSGFPWSSDICKRDVSYKKGICPIAENLFDNTFLGILFCHFLLSDEDINNIAKVFHKVWKNLNSLK